MKTGFVRAALVAGGFFYLLSGLGLLFAPEWFFENVGNYPPFNRHYSGDLGAFLLPLGVALLWAARSPAQHRGLIAFAVAGSLLHAGNHLYDDLAGRLPPGGWLLSSVGTFIFAAVLAAAYFVIQPSESSVSSTG
jgi:hypothetical protein